MKVICHTANHFPPLSLEQKKKHTILAARLCAHVLYVRKNEREFYERLQNEKITYSSVCKLCHYDVLFLR